MTNKKLTYESANAELELILTRMKSGEIGIDELAESVERASKLLLFCHEKLDKTEESVEKILKDLGLES